MKQSKISRHFSEQGALPMSTEVTMDDGGVISISDGIKKTITMMQECNYDGGTIYFIGNGGSAAIASHMAEDYMKNGGIRAQAFNDAALLTCFGNDYGFENMFTEMLRKYTLQGDMVVAISSSGKSPNIVKAAEWSVMSGIDLITLSAFNRDNPLNHLGDINFYVPCNTYGGAEITHLALLHAMLDFICEEKIQ